MRTVRLSTAMTAVITFVLVTTGPPSSARPAIAFGRPVVAIASCPSGCFEPTVAVDHAGRVFVTNGGGDAIAVSTDGARTFTRRPTPPVPPLGIPALGGDAIVQIDPQGRLVYSRLVDRGVQFAVSSTAGRTWDWNTLVGDPMTTAPAADRQWVGFGRNGTVYVIWHSVVGPGPFWIAQSTDGGRTFGLPLRFLRESRYSPSGLRSWMDPETSTSRRSLASARSLNLGRLPSPRHLRA